MRRSDTVRERGLAAAVLLAAAGLAYLTLRRGWFPHDVGALGQAADRVLAGELPHRDFYDIYTGGLSFLNALAFSVLGESILSARLVFCASYLVWVAVFWAVARRLTGLWLAAVATLLAAASTLPVYPEGMPSWYNLFLATAGVWALLRYDREGRRRWLVLAGFAGGVSLLFKIIGLYYLAGSALYLLFHEATRNSRSEGTGSATTLASDVAYRTVSLLGLTVSGAALTLLVSGAGSLAALVYFAIPPLAAIGVVARQLARPTAYSSSARLARLWHRLAPLCLGAAIPVGIFLIPYLVTGALGQLWEGVFVLPQKRFQDAAVSPPPLLRMIPAVAVVVGAWVAPRLRGAGERPLWMALAGLLLVGLATSGRVDVYRAFWSLPGTGGVVVSIALAWAIFRGSEFASRGVLVLSVFALCNLVQVPFSAPIYALYAFPLLVLLALAVAGGEPVGRRRWLGIVLTALTAFMLLRVDTGFLHDLGYHYGRHNQTEELRLPRAGGIRIPAAERTEYESVIRAVESLDPGEYILAFPDSPEIYFLSGRKNPTPLLFDFLQPEHASDVEALMATLDRLDVRVVVINRQPPFSTPADPVLLRALQARYPLTRDVGRFRIAWKD